MVHDEQVEIGMREFYGTLTRNGGRKFGSKGEDGSERGTGWVVE